MEEVIGSRSKVRTVPTDTQQQSPRDQVAAFVFMVLKKDPFQILLFEAEAGTRCLVDQHFPKLI